jgi:hypothetical protein
MRTVLSAVTILLGACSPSMQTGDPASDVRLTVEPMPAAAGDSVVLTLHFGTAGQVGYNLCTSSVERQTAAGWEAIPSDVVCTMELRVLEGGQEATWRTAVASGLSPGEYRYTTGIEAMPAGERHVIASSSFRLGS